MSHNSRIEELRRRVQTDPASIAFAALAEEYRRAGQFEDAIATCEAGLQRHPAYVSARVTLGRSLLELGRFDEARHQLEHVLRTAPENLAAIRALAEIHGRVGDYSQASHGTLADDRDSHSAPRRSAASAVTPPAPPAPPSPAFGPPAPAPRSAQPAPVAPPARVAAPPLIPPPAPRPVPPPPVHVSPQPSAPPARVPHPDEAALPALEAFLAAILAAKASARQPFE
jgi:tetratricopeptide (TPR) repeat protein